MLHSFRYYVCSDLVGQEGKLSHWITHQNEFQWSISAFAAGVSERCSLLLWLNSRYEQDSQLTTPCRMKLLRASPCCFVVFSPAVLKQIGKSVIVATVSDVLRTLNSLSSANKLSQLEDHYRRCTWHGFHWCHREQHDFTIERPSQLDVLSFL